MRAFFCSLVLLSAISIAAPAMAQLPERRPIPPVAVATGDKAPELVGWNLDNTVQQYKWNSRPLHVVQFWASYSQPSIDQLSTLQELHSTLGERLQVLSATWERLPLENLKALRSDVGLEFEMFRPHPKFDMAWKSVGAFPTTFLVDGEGRILRRYLGWSEEHRKALLADVNSVLDGEPMTSKVSPTAEHYVTPGQYSRQRK